MKRTRRIVSWPGVKKNGSAMYEPVIVRTTSAANVTQCVRRTGISQT
jgi:hypothetical protein